MSAIKGEVGDPALWHRRLGHVPMRVLRKIKEFNTNSSFTIDHCHICPQDRQTRISFPNSYTNVNVVFDLIHIDLWGPYKVATYDGMRYFITLVDDKSRGKWTFLIRLKSDVVVVLK